MVFNPEKRIRDIINEIRARNLDTKEFSVGTTRLSEKVIRQRHDPAEFIIEYFTCPSNEDALYIYDELVKGGFQGMDKRKTTDAEKELAYGVNIFYLEPRGNN